MAAPGSYSLKWHGHGLHVNASVSSLYKSESFTDLVLATSDGRYFSAHQFVLSSCSQYLHKMIMIGSSFKTLSKIVIIMPPEIKHSTLNILLQYIYKGEAIVNHEQLPNIMKAAELLQISGLCLGKDKSPSIVDMLNNSPSSEQAPKQQNKNNPNPAEQKNKRELTKINHRVLIPEVKYSEPEIVILNDVNDNKSKSSTTSNNVKRLAPSKSSSPARKKIKESCDISLDIQVDSKCHRSSEDDMIEEVVVEEEVQIKDEPIDWEDQKSNDGPDEFVKQEVVSEEEEELELEDKESCYVPLTCDLCQETFTTPSLWVRHIEKSHPFTALASGRLSSQKEESGAEYPPLNCELCQQVFDVPAEWVRHIQSHTEQQLAIENDLAMNSRGRVECNVCGKILQSQASMQIHARTHTGERPYLCKVCGREFNVKSNYLRHLRTLHDQLIPPSLVETPLKRSLINNAK